MNTAKQTVDSYINNFPPEVQTILREVQKVIREVVPGADEVISYGIPTFKVNGRPVVYYSGWRDHISLYPIPKGNDVFQEKITPFIAGKGTLRFSLNKPIPYAVIKEVAATHFKERMR